MSSFKSAHEFREVVDRTLTIISEHDEMGPQLRRTATSLRFEFTDFEMAVGIRGCTAAPPSLEWEWTRQLSWQPKVRLMLDSETVNRYFQGKENLVAAVARRRIKAGGDVKTAITILAITKPLSACYREMIRADYPHLEV